MKVLLLCNKTLDNFKKNVSLIKNKLEGLGIEYTENPSDNADLIITVGGDGTILHEAETALGKDVAILGINTGHLGFMASLETDNLGLLERLKTGEYETEEHLLLDVFINGEHKKTVLNEFSVIREGYNGIADITLTVDNDASFSYRADGLIVATPTGSSAYSFSAGGPIIEKSASVFMITPVCPHSLMNRSLVITPEHEIKITAESRSNLLAVGDGEEISAIEKQTEILIKRSEKRLKMITFPENSYFRVIKKKLL